MSRMTLLKGWHCDTRTTYKRDQHETRGTFRFSEAYSAFKGHPSHSGERSYLWTSGEKSGRRPLRAEPSRAIECCLMTTLCHRAVNMWRPRETIDCGFLVPGYVPGRGPRFGLPTGALKFDGKLRRRFHSETSRADLRRSFAHLVHRELKLIHQVRRR